MKIVFNGDLYELIYLDTDCYIIQRKDPIKTDSIVLKIPTSKYKMVGHNPPPMHTILQRNI